MAQLNHDYTNGQIGTYDPDSYVVSVANPIALGTSNLDVNGGDDNGTYRIGLYLGTDQLATASFAAVSQTAAQIAAGLVAAALADPTFSGFLKSFAVHSTDEALATYWDPTSNYYLVIESDPSTDLLVTNTAPARTTVQLAEIIQANGSGGWTRTYTDASFGLGVVARSSDYVIPFDAADPGGAQGPCQLALVKAGAINVPVTPGVTVSRGNKVAYSPTTKTWQTTVAGTYVLVEGAQWQTTGTGVQKVLVRFPSET
jgi:hypothetical protein